jgi:hypothetical protein
LIRKIAKHLYPDPAVLPEKNLQESPIYIKDELALPAIDQSLPAYNMKHPDIAKKVYQQRFFKEGHSLLVLFKNDRSNLLKLSHSVSPELAEITMIKIVELITQFQHSTTEYTKCNCKL